MKYQQFYAVLDEWRERPYDFVEANCCQFAADIARCSGVDIKVRRFETPEAAAKWIKKQGCRSLYHYLVKLFGKPVAPLQASRGFIAYRKGEGLDGSAIGAIERKALFVGSNGLIELPLSACACAFDPGKYRG
ncbi:hypothetical protein LCGC14_2310930 [marine sediment metagenome]|uniref:DUF6950 domain-containing protein n=1 Tax=marine sediment metagenome TaxID=412755 RepID=A0A0F9EY17_9ZZZZ